MGLDPSLHDEERDFTLALNEFSARLF